MYTDREATRVDKEDAFYILFPPPPLSLSLSLQSLLHYGSEVWVLDADHTPVKRVHLFALKMSLNASLRTPDLMVYGETGRYPLFVNISVKCITVWLRILKMPPCRLPFTPYKMLLYLLEQNKTTWSSSVCYLLCKYDFGDILGKSGRWRRKDNSKGIQGKSIIPTQTTTGQQHKNQRTFYRQQHFQILLIPVTVPE